jgi:hypothetical protein
MTRNLNSGRQLWSWLSAKCAVKGAGTAMPSSGWLASAQKMLG